ncbi:MAG: oligosaccharide flippase family protein [Armatimonadota bacterium]|nr:oligosaccharide flippase family protein [Armatimonadota bacterium]
MAGRDEERFQDRQPQRKLRATTAVTLIGGSSYVALVAGLVRSIIVMRLIGPRGRGIQRLAGLYKGYLSNLSVGWRHGVSKELPLAIGAEDAGRAAQVEDTGYLAVGVVSLLAGLGMVAYALWLSPHQFETRVALAIGGGLLAAEEMVALYWSVLRSWESFGTLAIGELVRTFAQLGLMILGAWLLGVTGVMLGWLAAALILLGFLDLASRIRVSAKVDWQQVWGLLLIGFPVALISFADILLRSIDGAVLVHFYGEERFGLYTVAMQMAAYLFALPQAAGFVIWPKVLESYGAEADGERRSRRVLLPTIALASVMPVIGGTAWLLMPAAVNLLVPRFALSVPAAQVLSLGATFLALPLASNAALVANDREPVVIATKMAGALVAGGGTLYLVTHEAALSSVALVACTGFTVAALLSLAVQLQEIIDRREQLVRELALAIAPTVWVAGALGAAGQLAGGLPEASVPGALLRVLVFLALGSPCLLYAHRRTGIGRELLALLRDRSRS